MNIKSSSIAKSTFDKTLLQRIPFKFQQTDFINAYKFKLNEFFYSFWMFIEVTYTCL